MHINKKVSVYLLFFDNGVGIDRVDKLIEIECDSQGLVTKLQCSMHSRAEEQ
jgi:hypothetical protein